MRVKHCFITATLLLASLIAKAQKGTDATEVVSDSWKERGVALGISQGNYVFADIGHYRSYVYRMGVLPIYSTSILYGSEFSYIGGLVVAPKIQARIHFYFINISLAPILYIDFASSSLKLRPEIGVGNHRFDINYGYNINLINNDFTKLNRHLLSLHYYLRIKQRAYHSYDSQGKLIK